MTPLTVARLAEAEQVIAKATPGPWLVHRPQKHYYILNHDGRYVLESHQYGVRTPYDAEFIALSRTLLPDLLALVQGLVRLRPEIRKQIAELERLHVVWGFEGAPFDAELRLLRQFEALIPKGDE
jgi:hypothetical protein